METVGHFWAVLASADGQTVQREEKTADTMREIAPRRTFLPAVTFDFAATYEKGGGHFDFFPQSGEPSGRRSVYLSYPRLVGLWKV